MCPEIRLLLYSTLSVKFYLCTGSSCLVKAWKAKSHADTLLHDVGLRWKTDFQTLSSFRLLGGGQAWCGRTHPAGNEVEAARERPDSVFRNEATTAGRWCWWKRWAGCWADWSSRWRCGIPISGRASPGTWPGCSVPRIVLLIKYWRLLSNSSQKRETFRKLQAGFE